MVEVRVCQYIIGPRAALEVVQATKVSFFNCIMKEEIR